MGIAVIVFNIYTIHANYVYKSCAAVKIVFSFLKGPASTLSIESLCNLGLVPIFS